MVIPALLRAIMSLVRWVVFTVAAAFMVSVRASMLVAWCKMRVTATSTGTTTIVASIVLAAKCVISMGCCVWMTLLSTRFHAIEISWFIGYSDVFKTLLQTVDSLFVRGEESVSTIHPQLTLSHLFGFLNLVRIQSHGCHYVNITGSILSICWLTLSLLVIFFHISRLLLISCSVTILLSYFIFHLCDRVAF